MREQKASALKKVYEKLLEQGKIRSQKDFAERVKYQSGPISLMLSAKKAIPFTLLAELYKLFNVNIHYFLAEDKERMFLDDAPVEKHRDLEIVDTIKNRNSILEKEIEVLKQRITDKDKIIALLEKREA